MGNASERSRRLHDGISCRAVENLRKKKRETKTRYFFLLHARPMERRNFRERIITG